MDLAIQYAIHRLLLGETDESFQSPNSLIKVTNGAVMVDVAATGDIDSLITNLESLGFVAAAKYGAVVSGYIPIQALIMMADTEAVQFIRPAYEPVFNQGIITNQGNVALRADVAQAEFGVTGAGVTVGVLSDSFDNLGGATADRLSGDLPDVNVLLDLPGGGSDEGRAMLQLIADIAPGADLAFHTAFLGQVGFAQGILNLAAAGADVIVDDVIYLAEPFFQDGIVAQAVNQVVAEGVAYFSAAGNNGDTAYESVFRNSGTILAFGNFQVEAHDFDPGVEIDIFQTITVGAGAEINLSFQWASPYFSASGIRGAISDLDIFLLNQNNQVVAASFNDNINGDPVEILSFRNNNPVSTQYNLVIGKFSGEAPSLIKYVGFGDLSIDEFDTSSGTLFGQANARGAQAVGAAFFGESPAFGNPSPTIESFSAIGGTPILFDSQGNRLAVPDIRKKPDIVATDGGNTTFFGQDIGSDADTFPNFFGTSAAAPNAAAVAALLLEAVPNASPAEIYQALQMSALDLDDPNTAGFDVGFDSATGFGLIQADAALRALLDSQLSGLFPGSTLIGTVQGETLVGTANGDIIQSLAGNDIVRGDAGNDILFGDEGDDILLGGPDSDTLWGGLGNDILNGGSGEGRLGSDTFVLGAGTGTDIITDFELGIDVIGLSGISTDELSFIANIIRFNNKTLAIINGITDAAAVDFVMV
ncbi:MAG: S8 family serine peptidase [Symploca sp. SIO2G7]|nr:S8 family serine peptidase [Symploca sp. SIO2G7]